MSNDTLTPKIELLQEQIESIEKGGFFTEKEIETKAAPLRMALAILKHQKSLYELNNVLKFGMSLEQFLEGTRAFNECFAQMPKLPKKTTDIEVIDAEILTPNSITA
jgi:hypothetical protein